MVQSWKETLTAPRRRVGATSERKSGTACFGSFFFFFLGGANSLLFYYLLLSRTKGARRASEGEIKTYS